MLHRFSKGIYVIYGYILQYLFSNDILLAVHQRTSPGRSTYSKSTLKTLEQEQCIEECKVSNKRTYESVYVT